MPRAPLAAVALPAEIYPQSETETHRKALAGLREAVGKRQPGLAVEAGLMALDGSIQMFG
jgi:hypothetical protein